jgi:hypothetical protein
MSYLRRISSKTSLAGRTSVGYILEGLTDSFLFIRAGRNVEQTLVGFGVLHDGRRLPVHGKHDGALALFLAAS